MDWIRSDAIGHGSFATVNMAFHGRNRADGMIMAVKSCAFYDGALALLKKEMKVMTELRDCPQIIRCLGDELSFENGLQLYNVFMEYASGGSLADLLRKTTSSPGLPEPEVRRITKSVLEGLKHIHGRGFTHCDIKLDNILLCGNEGKYEAKISDFGLTTEAFQENRRSSGYELRGTPMYMAPESLIRGEYAPPADVWALGCVVAQLASGRPVWRCSSVTELLLRIGVGKEVPEIPPEGCLSEEGRDFLRRCFGRDPSRRWTAEMLLNHPFVIQDDDAVPFMEAEKDAWSRSTSSPRCPLDFANPASCGSPSHDSTASTTPLFSGFVGQFYSPESSPSPSERISLLAVAGTEKPNWSLSDGWIAVRMV